MAATKVTFTLDPATIRRIQDASIRLSLPKSQVVREAIQDYYEGIGRLSEREKQRLLRALDECVRRVPSRSLSGVEREIQSVRQARRGGGRGTSRQHP